MKGNYLDFIEALGKRESNNNYKCVNTLGYKGRWQFGKARLYDLGISLDGWHPKNKEQRRIITTEQFLNDPKLQDGLMRQHVMKWRDVVLKKYKKYIGRVIAGVDITLSGMVAGLHLKGEGSEKSPGLKQFLESGDDNTDAYGTGIIEYIQKFGGYNLEDRQIQEDIEWIDKHTQPRPVEEVKKV